MNGDQLETQRNNVEAVGLRTTSPVVDHKHSKKTPSKNNHELKKESLECPVKIESWI